MRLAYRSREQRWDRRSRSPTPSPAFPGPVGLERPVGPAWMHLAAPVGLAAPVWTGVVGLTARVDPAHSGLVGPG